MEKNLVSYSGKNAWVEKNTYDTMFLYTNGFPIYLNENCKNMFLDCNNLKFNLLNFKFDYSFVTDMENFCRNCSNLTGEPICGPNVTTMKDAYTNCVNLINAACGPNVVNMDGTYSGCANLKNAACGPNVVNMWGTYWYCNSLINAVCGPNVAMMNNTYRCCNNLKNAACGDNVFYMDNTYANCNNLTKAACGNNVMYMHRAYANCNSLTKAVFGPNVRNIDNAYADCPNLYGNVYISADNIGNFGAASVFANHNNIHRLNVFVRPNTHTCNVFMPFNIDHNPDGSGDHLGFGYLKLDRANECYYNAQGNGYIYYNWDGIDRG